MTGALARVAAFVRLGRPHFLVGGFLLYGLGAAVAAASGARIVWELFWLGQAAVTAFQLMTHYANDFFDYEADRANATPTRFSGGSRVLAGGELPRGTALVAALVLAAAGVALSIAVARDGRSPVWVSPALAATFVLSWGYSAPPLRLHSTGLGELDTALVVTGLVPFLGFCLQAPGLAGLPVLLCAITPLACLQVAMLLAIEFPDAAGDAAVGKRTLVVRLGPRRAGRVYTAVLAAAYLGLPALVAAGLPAPAALAAAAPAPIALWRVRRALAGDLVARHRWESVAFWSVALLVATAAAELAAFVFLV